MASGLSPILPSAVRESLMATRLSSIAMHVRIPAIAPGCGVLSTMIDYHSRACNVSITIDFPCVNLVHRYLNFLLSMVRWNRSSIFPM